MQDDIEERPAGPHQDGTGETTGSAGNDGNGDSSAPSASFTIESEQQSSTDSSHAMEIAVRRLSCCAPIERTKRLQQTGEGIPLDIQALKAGVQNNDPYLVELIQKERHLLNEKKEPTTELGKLVKKHCHEDTEDPSDDNLITTLKAKISADLAQQSASSEIAISVDSDKPIVDALISDLTQESYHKNSYMHKIQKETTNRLGVDRRRRSYFSATKSVKPIKARASKNPLGLLSKNYRITYNEDSNSFEISFGGRVPSKKQAEHLFDTVVSAGLLGSDPINITLNTENPYIARKQTEALIKEANQRGIPLSTLQIRTPNLNPEERDALGIDARDSTLKSVLEQGRIFSPKSSVLLASLRPSAARAQAEKAAASGKQACQQYLEQNARHEDPDYKKAYRDGGSYLDPDKRIDLVHPDDYQKTQTSAEELAPEGEAGAAEELASEEEASAAEAKRKTDAKRLITRTKVSIKPDISDFDGCFKDQGNQLHSRIESDPETKQELSEQIKACQAPSDQALAEQVNKYRLLQDKAPIEKEKLMECIDTIKVMDKPNPSAQSPEGQAIDRSISIHPGKTPKFSTFIQSAAYKNLDEETLSPRQNALREAEGAAQEAEGATQERVDEIESTTLPTTQGQGLDPGPTPGQTSG